MRKKRQRAVGEKEERYIYLLAPNGHRTQGVGRDGARGLEIGRDRARDLGVGRDLLIRLKPSGKVSVGANFLVPRLKCVSASLQVRQCRTMQDSKGNSEE